jgi:hypothetical protein
MVLAPTNRNGSRLRKRYGKIRNSLFTFLEHPDVPPDNNGSERELPSTAKSRRDFVLNGAPIYSQTFDPSLASRREDEPMHIRLFVQC